MVTINAFVLSLRPLRDSIDLLKLCARPNKVKLRIVSTRPSQGERPNQLSCLSRRFYGLQSRISNRIYSETMHDISSCEGLLQRVYFNFI